MKTLRWCSLCVWSFLRFGHPASSEVSLKAWLDSVYRLYLFLKADRVGWHHTDLRSCPLFSQWGRSAAPTYSTSVDLAVTTHTHTPAGENVPFCWTEIKFLFLCGVLKRGLGTVLGHCSPPKRKTYRLLMDVGVCLLFLEDAKGDSGRITASQMCLMSSHLHLSFSLISHEFIIKKIACFVYTEKLPLTFLLYILLQCAFKAFFLTMNHLYFL